MSDKYSQQQFQKFLEKKKENKKKTYSPLDKDIQRRACEIENDTHEKAKQAYSTLHRSSKKQKQTTELLEAQGEKLDQASIQANKINENMKECHRLSGEIKKAGKIFGFSIPVISNIKSYFSKEARMDRKLHRLNKKNRVSGSDDALHHNDSGYESEDNFGNGNQHSKENEDLSGEEKTDEELKRILRELKGMNKESSRQQHLIKSHTGKIGEISRMNDNSEHYMNTTNEELKRL